MYAIVKFSPKCTRHYDPHLNSLHLILSTTFFNYLIAFMCRGQPDSHFISMVNAEKGKIISSDGKIAASFDQYAPVGVNGEHYRATV